MRIDYSKSLSDVRKESLLRLADERALFESQSAESTNLLRCENRAHCILCNSRTAGASFTHRGLPLFICDVCGHVQTRAIPPHGYPNVAFSSVYPKLPYDDYQDRKKRIYKPKLDWILDCLESELGMSMDRITRLRWLEIGAGAGYFVSALVDAGVENVLGLDSDAALVEVADSFVPGNRIIHYPGNIVDVFSRFEADAYVAFFVFEHLSDLHPFLMRMRDLPAGTILVFSVPVYGFSCLLENVFEENFARNLDCVLHTQLFTDKSIDHAMKLAEFDILAKWIFGQDSSDLTRFLVKGLSRKLPGELLETVQSDCIGLENELQSSLDRLGLADQRHLLAIKR